MNEYIDVEFRTPAGKRLRIARQVTGGIELDEPDPIERTVGIQLTPRGEATRQRMRRIAQVKGWDLGQFKLDVAVEDGNLVLRGVDADSLPEGLYALRLEIEEATTGPKVNLEIKQDGHAPAKVTVTLDARDVAVDLSGADPAIQGVLEASTIDNVSAADWLHADKRPTRKACLLNLLASLRVRPGKTAALLPHVHHAFKVFNDRAFMRVDRALLPTIEALVKDPKKPFYAEGEPTAPIHKKLLEAIPPAEQARFTNGLLSFRGEGRPSLQMVIAVPPVDLPYTYAEFDLDLANPLQDVLGFIVHMGELMDGKPTNHLDLRKDLQKTPAKDFLYYSIV